MVWRLNLHEDLGQIEYIFSDKTGMTRNEMVFKKCSVGGSAWSEGEADDGEERAVNAEAIARPGAEKSAVEDFFLALAVCHTVVPEVKNGMLEYQAESPCVPRWTAQCPQLTQRLLVAGRGGAGGWGGPDGLPLH